MCQSHMKAAFKTVVALCALASVVACGTPRKVIVVDGIEMYEAEWDKTQGELRNRMKFDTDCVDPAMQFTLFKKQFRYPTEVGVSGCGTRVMYTRAAVGAALGPWHLDTMSEPAGTSAGSEMPQSAPSTPTPVAPAGPSSVAPTESNPAEKSAAP